MGASQWAVWVEWRGDAAASLEAARQQVFAEGAYYGGTSRRAKPPKTIAALLRRVGELGTHSILDMSGVAPTRGLGVAAPLSDDQLDALFETTAPTRAQVEAEAHLIELLRPRGEGTYVVAYDGGAPVAVYFVGRTGM